MKKFCRCRVAKTFLHIQTRQMEKLQKTESHLVLLCALDLCKVVGITTHEIFEQTQQISTTSRQVQTVIPVHRLVIRQALSRLFICSKTSLMLKETKQRKPYFLQRKGALCAQNEIYGIALSLSLYLVSILFLLHK